MSERDLTALVWLSQMWGAPRTQVGQLLRPDCDNFTLVKYSTAQALLRWHMAGWVDIERVTLGDQWVFPRAPLAGQLLGWEVKPWRPTMGKANHTKTVNAVRLSTCGVDTSRWTSERELLHEVGFRGTGERTRVPDGVVDIAGERWMVEVELTQKSREAMEEAVRGWPDAAERWDARGVKVYAADAKIASWVHEAVAAVCERHPNGVGGQLAALELTIEVL